MHLKKNKNVFCIASGVPKNNPKKQKPTWLIEEYINSFFNLIWVNDPKLPTIKEPIPEKTNRYLTNHTDWNK